MVVGADAELFAEAGSEVVVDTVAVFEMALSPARLAAVWTTSVKLADTPRASVGRVAVTVPVPPTSGVARLHPAGPVIDTNVVPVGSVSLSCTVCASLGPLLTTAIVYVRFVPARIGSGESTFVTARSARVLTCTLTVAVFGLLPGSVVELVTVAVFDSVVPLSVLGFTWTVSVKTAVSPGAMLPVAVTLPVPPTGGVLGVQPADTLNDTKVVLSGTASLS
jgi:hypothetical protein